jgi:hypothetical protein
MSELDDLREQVARLRRDVGQKDRVLHEKNQLLDALGYVWCNGGCNGGLFRFTEPPEKSFMKLTAAAVSAVERNTIRLRTWFESRRCRESQQHGGAKLDKCVGCLSEETCERKRSKS